MKGGSEKSRQCKLTWNVRLIPDYQDTHCAVTAVYQSGSTHSAIVLDWILTLSCPQAKTLLCVCMNISTHHQSPWREHDIVTQEWPRPLGSLCNSFYITWKEALATIPHNKMEMKHCHPVEKRAALPIRDGGAKSACRDFLLLSTAPRKPSFTLESVCGSLDCVALYAQT